MKGWKEIDIGKCMFDNLLELNIKVIIRLLDAQ